VVKLRSKPLEWWSSLVTVISLPLVIFTLGLTYYQLKEGQKTAKLTNFIALTEAFFNETNTEIINTLYEGKPILKRHKGSFTLAQLDNFLGDFDTIYAAFEEDLLSEKQICISFSYYLYLANTTGEIKTYISTERSKQAVGSDQPFFSGFDHLFEVVSKSKFPECRKQD
jgi:hypothetical protein